MTLSMAGRCARMLTDGVDEVVEGAQVLDTERVRDADVGEQPATAALRAERSSRGSAPYIGMPRLMARSRSSSVVL